MNIIAKLFIEIGNLEGIDFNSKFKTHGIKSYARDVRGYCRSLPRKHLLQNNLECIRAEKSKKIYQMKKDEQKLHENSKIMRDKLIHSCFRTKHAEIVTTRNQQEKTMICKSSVTLESFTNSLEGYLQKKHIQLEKLLTMKKFVYDITPKNFINTFSTYNSPSNRRFNNLNERGSKTHVAKCFSDSEFTSPSLKKQSIMCSFEVLEVMKNLENDVIRILLSTNTFKKGPYYTEEMFTSDFENSNNYKYFSSWQSYDEKQNRNLEDMRCQFFDILFSVMSDKQIKENDHFKNWSVIDVVLYLEFYLSNLLDEVGRYPKGDIMSNWRKILEENRLEQRKNLFLNRKNRNKRQSKRAYMQSWTSVKKSKFSRPITYRSHPKEIFNKLSLSDKVKSDKRTFFFQGCF